MFFSASAICGSAKATDQPVISDTTTPTIEALDLSQDTANPITVALEYAIGTTGDSCTYESESTKESSSACESKSKTRKINTENKRGKINAEK